MRKRGRAAIVGCGLGRQPLGVTHEVGYAVRLRVEPFVGEPVGRVERCVDLPRLRWQSTYRDERGGFAGGGSTTGVYISALCQYPFLVIFFKKIPMFSIQIAITNHTFVVLQYKLNTKQY